jgi:adenosine kinase
MNVIISGSLAYDRIMDFPGYFVDHILPDKLHVLNVCFQVNGMKENYGGTAGNIAYSLKLMGGSPSISATIGLDYSRYFQWMEENDLSTGGIRVIGEEFTAGAYITTDKADNQITGFNPGAMKYSSNLDFSVLHPQETMVIVSPGNLDDMINYPRRCREKGIRYIFDPGQALPVLQAEDLLDAITGCAILIVNDYEFELILSKTGQKKEALLERVTEATIVTLGEHGSDIYSKAGVEKIAPFTARKVLDPTGCGDAYRGGLLSGLLAGCGISESARLGSACASFAVECYGTQVHSFTTEEFNTRLQGL